MYTVKKITFIFFLLVSTIKGQDSLKSIYNQGFDIRTDICFLSIDFNTNDFYWSFSGGIEDVGYQWGARLNFDLRPFYKKVQTPIENYITRQYKEQKYFLSIDLDKRLGHLNLWNTHTQFFIGSKNGLLWGDYKGTKNDFKSRFLVAPMGGICFNFDDMILLKIGYLYFDEGNTYVPNGKITLGVHFVI